MSPRSPGRFLAPLALVAAVVAVYAILTSGGSDTATTGTPAPVVSTTAPAARRQTGATRRTYVVRPGDTLSAIATRTGVSLARIQALNPNVDAESLHAGQKIKLATAAP